jgi:DNA repair protein RadC
MSNEERHQEDLVVSQALQILDKRIKNAGDLLRRHSDIRNFLALNISELEHEVFGVILLDTRNRYITHEVLFRGTLLHTAVSPREVVKFALKHNASKMVLYHNHPVGPLTPSNADKDLTKCLTDILKVIDVQVVDHVIVYRDKSYSFNDNKLLEG